MAPSPALPPNPQPAPPPSSTRIDSGLRALLKGLLMIALLAATVWAAERLGLFGLDQHWIDATVRGQGLRGDLAFIAAGALFTAVGMPRQVLAFLGGYAFGFVTGTALALAATVCGAALTLAFARGLGRTWLRQRFARRMAKVDAFLGRSPFAMALVIRLLPVGSNLLTNLLAGLAQVRTLPFLAGSALGFVPQTLIFALAGSGVNLQPELRFGIAAALLVASSLIGMRLYRQHRQAAQLEEEIVHPET